MHVRLMLVHLMKLLCENGWDLLLKLLWLIIFLRRAHTVTVLLIMLCVLVYVGAFEKTKENSEYNTKRYEYFL